MTIHHSCFKNPFEAKAQGVNWKNDFPESSEYLDRFFQDNAIAEIHDVFISPNHLIERWLTSTRMTIGELGFGFGLNFLATAELWQKHKGTSQIETLNYIAIDEALPTKAQIGRVLKNFPELRNVGDDFLTSYEPIHNDTHTIDIPTLNLRLTLIQNTANDACKNLLGYSNNRVDAWYLDGFDPSKNKEMWSQDLAQAIGMLSSKHATFGTFTAAGFVKRNFQKFGFEVTKSKGFGTKRHKLTGRLNSIGKKSEGPKSNNKRVAVIGSGIAGSCAAFHAAKHGAMVDVFEYGQEVASGTSSNPIAALYPRFSNNNSPYAYLIAQSYFFAEKLYASLSNGYVQSGLLFTHPNDYQAEWMKSMEGLQREDLFEVIPKAQMIAEHGLDSKGLKMLQGGYLLPKILCAELLNHASIKVHPEHCLENWSQKNLKINLQFSNQDHGAQYDALIIASGAGLMNLLPNLTISKGQLVGLSQKQDHAPKLPINSEGYILPSLHGITWLGATYDREFQDMEPSKSSGELLISNTERSLGIEFNNPEDHLMEARFRVGSKDRIPMAGKLNSHENIYVMGALGSRGFSLAPLLGEFISSMIHDIPSPISTGIALSLDPNRFTN